MGLLTTSDTADLRTDAELALSDTCYVLRGTVTADEFSAAGSASVGTANTYACRVRELSVSEAERAGIQVQAQGIWAITLPHNAVVRASDQIRYGTRTFEVTDPTGAMTDAVVQRVYAIEGT